MGLRDNSFLKWKIGSKKGRFKGHWFLRVLVFA